MFNKDFDSWLWEKDISDFYLLPFCMQWGAYLEFFFERAGTMLEVGNMWIGKEQFFYYTVSTFKKACTKEFIKDFQEAQEESVDLAIKLYDEL